MLVDLFGILAFSISHPGSLAMCGIQFSPGTSGGSSGGRALTEGTLRWDGGDIRITRCLLGPSPPRLTSNCRMK